MGGSLSMQQVDSIPGKYIITLHIFINTNNFVANEKDLLKAEINQVRVIRRRGNLFLSTPQLNFDRSEEINYTNPACQSANGSHIREYKYITQVQWDVNDFDDNQGYYLAYERCCRDNNIFTINKAGETGMVFYLEFPPLKNYPYYSSPVFPLFNGEVVCFNTLSTFNLSAIDTNNDILKYRLVSPWKGNSALNNPRPAAGAAPYNLVDWRSGYSEYNIVNGDPTLSIDQDNGLLTVKAVQIGTFIFTVQVDKYRDGKWIGLVRHDFQFFVTICSSKGLTDPVITQNNQAIQSAGICNNQSITLETELNTDWSYQWQKNGHNIPAAKLNTLNVSEPGEYTVVKSLKHECTSNTTSKIVKVVDERNIKPEIVSTATTICDGQPIKLSVAPKPNTTFTWYKGTNTLAKVDLIDVSSPGTYMVEGLNTQNNCLSLKDTPLSRRG